MGTESLDRPKVPPAPLVGFLVSTFPGGKLPKIWNRGSHFEVITTEASDTARNLGGFDMTVMAFDAVDRTAHCQGEVVDRNTFQNAKRRIKMPETVKS